MAEERANRLIFMGTPEFAGIILRKLIQDSSFNIVGVYTQPDKKSGRGLQEHFSEVKQIALENNLDLYQPSSLRKKEAIAAIEKLKPDFIVAAAYGLILPQEVLDLPTLAPLNVHGSLLPLYRGASPIQTAIMENWQPDAETGVSIMKMVAAMDAGPVYAQKEVPINRLTQEDLSRLLAAEGADLLMRVMKDIQNKGLQPVPQDDSKATYTKKLDKSMGSINWNCPAAQVDALIRAVTPWPGAATKIIFSDKEIPVTLFPGKLGTETNGIEPGTVERDKNGLRIACADRWYYLDKIKPKDKKIMAAKDFANGQCKIKNGICGKAAAQNNEL